MSTSQNISLLADKTLVPAKPAATDLPQVKGWVRGGFLIILLGVGGFLLWAHTLQLAGGAYAGGMVRLSEDKQTVSHVEGGIIRELNVDEGQSVEAGAALAVLDDYNSGTNLSILSKQRDELLVRRARLEAVRDNSNVITFPPEITDAKKRPYLDELVQTQERQFISERANIEGQKSILQQRLAQHEAAIEALQSQISAVDTQLLLIEEEVASVTTLLDKGLERKPRLLSLQREQASLQSERSSYAGQIATSEKEITEVQMQMTNIDNDAKNKAITELTEVQQQFTETEEKLSNAAMRSNELTLRANITGTVLNLRHKTVGAVVPPNQPILEIVSAKKVYVVDVRIMPNDIDEVQVGLPAQIRLSGLKQRTHMSVGGEVLRVSSDALADERTGTSYFEARVAFNEEDLQRKADEGDLPAGTKPAILKDILYPGMPAEVTIVTQSRTMLEYLFQPLKDSFARAFHES